MDDASVIAKVKADLTWIQKHERIILVLAGGLVLWFAIGKIDTLIANHDHANLQQAEVAAAVQTEKNQALAAQVAQQAADYKALADKVSLQNAQLEQANVALANSLAQRQKTDATLPPTELATRWVSLVPNSTVTITNGQATLPIQSAVATVQELEKVPVLSSQIENDRTQLGNEKKLLDASDARVATLSSQVDGLKTQATLDAKVCTDQIAVVKADARKSKRNWFVAGFVAGISIKGVVKVIFGL